MTVLIVLLTLLLSACGVFELDANPNPRNLYNPVGLSEMADHARTGTLSPYQREIWCGILENFSSGEYTSFEEFWSGRGVGLAEDDDLLHGAMQQWADGAEGDGCEWATQLSSKDN